MDSRWSEVFDFHLTTNADDLSEATLSTSRSDFLGSEGSQMVLWTLASATSLPVEVGWPTLAKADGACLQRWLASRGRWWWSLASATWRWSEVVVEPCLSYLAIA